MDWFEKLFGFPEESYARTQANFVHKGRRLTSRANGRSWSVGEFEMTPLAELRRRFAEAAVPAGNTRVRIVQADVQKLHGMPEYAGALFQVASQFNALEMIGPNVTPEHGVTRYFNDHTQGPACALAAAPALIVRNYFAPVGGNLGQTRDQQLDGLADLGTALAEAVICEASSLWSMENGYAMCSREQDEAIHAHLSLLEEEALDHLRGRIRIAIQRGVEVTTPSAQAGHLVSQAFCSAVPVSYWRHESGTADRFATLVLEAAYEATLREAAIAAAHGGSNIALLTLLGGGAFGNDTAWIFQAIRRAVAICASVDLDIRIVSYGRPTPDLVQLVDGLSG